MALKSTEDAGLGGQIAPLDEVDRRIVAALRAQGRLSMRALADRLHISRASAYARVDRLERSGVITGYSATIDPQRYGYGVSADVFPKTSQQSCKSARKPIPPVPQANRGRARAGGPGVV